MLDLINTENRIEAAIDATNIKAKLIVSPGNLDDRIANPRMASNIVVRFKNINYDSKRINPKASCFSRLNTANFEIIINQNNLRTHEKVYEIAMTCIDALRGLTVASDENGLIVSNSSPIYISEFRYRPYDDNKACNKAEIVLSFDYTEVYSRQ